MSAAYLMAVPRGAAEAAQDLGSNGLAPGLNPLPAISLLIPVRLWKAPPLSCLHFPICKAMTMPTHKLAKHLLQSSDNSVEKAVSSYFAHETTKPPRGHITCPRSQATK